MELPESRIGSKASSAPGAVPKKWDRCRAGAPPTGGGDLPGEGVESELPPEERGWSRGRGKAAQAPRSAGAGAAPRAPGAGEGLAH